MLVFNIYFWIQTVITFLAGLQCTYCMVFDNVFYIFITKK